MNNPVMVLGSLTLVEAKPVKPQHPINGVCGECALGEIGRVRHCGAAVMGAAELAFGGDCETRDVIYVIAPQVPNSTKETANG